VLLQPKDAPLLTALAERSNADSKNHLEEPMNLKYPADVHWERESSIRSLNRCRAAIFLQKVNSELQFSVLEMLTPKSTKS